MLINKTKKIICIILATLFVGLFSVSISAVVYKTNMNKEQNGIINVQAYGGGDGSSGNPYLINNISHFNELANYCNSSVLNNYYGKYFKLTKDLDFEGQTFTPVAYGTGNEFSGIFDGDGHTISNVSINISGAKTTNTSEYNVGVFGRAFSATIKNLKVDVLTVTLSGNNVSAYSNPICIGGIAGSHWWETIENCEVDNFYVRCEDD